MSAAREHAERLKPKVEQVLSASAVARRLDRCPAWMTQAIKTGRITPDFMSGKSLFFRESRLSKLFTQLDRMPRLSEVLKHAMPPEGALNRLSEHRRGQIKAQIDANAPQEESK